MGSALLLYLLGVGALAPTFRPTLCHPERNGPIFSSAQQSRASGCGERDRGNTYSPTQADGNNHARPKQGEGINCYATLLQGNISMELREVLQDIADAIVRIDKSGKPFRTFQPGVGPYGEPQLVKRIAADLNQIPKYRNSALTKRTPDLLIPNEWAMEFKITRPFGDNDKEAENWSVNLLHPYPGNVSTIGDCYKLREYPGRERRSVVVVGYEHTRPKIDLTPLITSFEVIARQVLAFNLSERVEIRREGLIHPVHRALRLFAWEIT